MPLVIVCGFPCSGKTSFSRALANSLLESGASVHIVNEESENIRKDVGYQNSFSEKGTRGAIKSAVNVALSSDKYVIVDSLNYIKGYRYELYCIARSLRTPHCVCWVESSENDAIKWNEERKSIQGDAYSADILVDLRLRFETPNEKNRWDTPLFRVFNDSTAIVDGVREFPSRSSEGTVPQDSNLMSLNIGSEEKATQDTAGLIPMHNLSISELKQSIPEPPLPTVPLPDGTIASPPGPAIEISIRKPLSSWRPKGTSVPNVLLKMSSEVEGPGSSKAQISFSGSVLIADGVKGMSSSAAIDMVKTYFLSATAPAPNSSTVHVPHANADLLYELDRTSQAIIQTIISHQRDNLEGTPIIFHDYDRSLTIHRPIGMIELQRHKKLFVKTNAQVPPTSVKGVGSAFIDYLAGQL